ncbi:Outer membrane receptor for ferric coprogen and ferric-rhodotorulic acid [Bordetella ansorpii]|uniref:Outer membrane receptor for ferric coprogen and ferric-rhodotorulic acid n=2 Tax=Bordetella ansorpii TaxID=288768 RepID=A0A157SWI3_9BORD|nr:Outer membrane receptor for ferric coprogen and ferric-rhodotorulic acid [Bordetella ansorpii]
MPGIARLMRMAQACLGVAASCLLPSAHAAPPGGAQMQTPRHEPARVVFDIPRLPLHEALTRYSELTQYSVLYETGLVAGQYSHPVTGAHSVDGALVLLLQDSGLRARFTNGQSYILTRQPPVAGADPQNVRLRYEGLVQRRILGELCRHPALEAGRHRMAIRFWVGPEARLGPLQVSVAHRPDLETAVHEALIGLPLERPPEGVAQPAIMQITPDRTGRRLGCPE